MSDPEVIDKYIDVILKKDDDNVSMIEVELLEPILLNQRDDVSVSLCYMNYVHKEKVYKNVERAVIWFGMPAYTSVLDTNPNRLHGYADAEPVKPVAKWLQMSLEPAEYSHASLTDAINQELKNKLPSAFTGNECKVMINKHLNRTEIHIDGSDAIPPQNRASLKLFPPLPYILGFTASQDRDRTAVLGTRIDAGDYIINKTHAVASHSCKLTSPRFIHWRLDILEHSQSGEIITQNLATAERGEPPLSGLLLEKYFNPREYKKVSRNFPIIRRLRFCVVDETGKDYKAFEKMYLRLHFVSRGVLKCR